MENELVKVNCMVCGIEFMSTPPKMCCNAFDCGCRGLPVDPIVCSEECYDKGLSGPQTPTDFTPTVEDGKI